MCPFYPFKFYDRQCRFQSSVIQINVLGKSKYHVDNTSAEKLSVYYSRNVAFSLGHTVELREMARAIVRQIKFSGRLIDYFNFLKSHSFQQDQGTLVQVESRFSQLSDWVIIIVGWSLMGSENNWAVEVRRLLEVATDTGRHLWRIASVA